jgi:peptide/nickel transport system ATP-binding protein
MSETLLEVRDLSMTFPIKSGLLQRTRGYVYAVSGLSFELARGRTLGIVGESGSGKSSVAKCVIRLHEPTDGSIRFEGTEITHTRESELRESVRSRIQMVFQDPYSSLNPRQTLRAVIEEPLRVHRRLDGVERDAWVEQLIGHVGLDPSLRDRRPHEFSGGQRQRIAIARALALRPDLIIADEPVSALDVSVQAQIVNLLKDLQAEFGLTYIFISHDLSVVRHICDEVVVMYLGRLMEFAPRDRLFEGYRHPYTEALLSAVPSVRTREAPPHSRIVLQGDVPDSSAPPAGCVFHTRCPYAQERCRLEVPAVREIEPGHRIACHFPIDGIGGYAVDGEPANQSSSNLSESS